MTKIYMVAIRWVTTKTDAQMMDGVMGSVGDWFRWNAMTYFVQSNRSPTDIRFAVMSRLSPSDSVLVVEASTAGVDGWAPQWVWDWFSSRRNM